MACLRKRIQASHDLSKSVPHLRKCIDTGLVFTALAALKRSAARLASYLNCAQKFLLARSKTLSTGCPEECCHKVQLLVYPLEDYRPAERSQDMAAIAERCPTCSMPVSSEPLPHFENSHLSQLKLFFDSVIHVYRNALPNTSCHVVGVRIVPKVSSHNTEEDAARRSKRQWQLKLCVSWRVQSGTLYVLLNSVLSTVMPLASAFPGQGDESTPCLACMLHVRFFGTFTRPRRHTLGRTPFGG